MASSIQYHKEWWKENGDNVNQKRRERYAKDIEYRNRCKIASRRYRLQNPGKVRAMNCSPKALERKRLARASKRNEISEYNRRYHKENRDWRNEYHRTYGKLNRETQSMRKKEWRSNNRGVVKRIKHSYYHRVEKNSPKFKVAQSMRTLINRCLNDGKGGHHWETLVGYSLQDLMARLESQFDGQMTWENHGVHGWHIDHIRPISSFNFKSPDDYEFKECWALKNLQPLWAKDNCSKNKFWEGG